MSEKKHSYGRLFKASSIVGGAQAINMFLGMVRVKFVAVLLGPTGLGLLGMFQTIQGLAQTLGGVGINNSGVRDVAEAVGSEDEQRIGQTVLTLRRLCWLTGFAGALPLVVCAVPISKLSFQSDRYAGDIACLGLVVLMGLVAAGQMALLQGMRRIGDLARLNILSSITGTVVAIGFYSWLGMRGIIPALVTMSAVTLIASFWFSRKISVLNVQMSWRQSLVAAGGLVSLGLAFMWSGLMGVAAEYATRALIIHQINLAAVGIFTAAFRLSGMFLNFVLAAMGADFYPSLTAVSGDHQKMRDLVNEQTEIALLLAVPGLLATLALAPWIIRVFYTSEFTQSADLLQWFVLGCLVRVVSWSMVFIMLAKGSGRLFAITETIFHTSHVLAIWLALKYIGIEGVAIAFCLMYVCHMLAMLFISHRLILFRWSSSVSRLLLVLFPISILTMIQSRLLALWPATIINCIITVLVMFFCLRGLCCRLDSQHSLVRLCYRLPLSRYWLSSAI